MKNLELNVVEPQNGLKTMQQISFTNIGYKDTVGKDSDGNSVGLYCDGGYIHFYYKKKCVAGGMIVWNSFSSELRAIDTYFMLEINLLCNKIKLCSNAVYSGEKEVKSVEYSIPKLILDQLNETRMFRIGLSLFMNEIGNFGIGLVKNIHK